jgi:hypothetical protein
VEQVLGDVPKADRCRCKETKAAAPAGAVKQSWLDKLRAR